MLVVPKHFEGLGTRTAKGLGAFLSFWGWEKTNMDRQGGLGRRKKHPSLSLKSVVHL